MRIDIGFISGNFVLALARVLARDSCPLGLAETSTEAHFRKYSKWLQTTEPTKIDLFLTKMLELGLILDNAYNHVLYPVGPTPAPCLRQRWTPGSRAFWAEL